MLVPYNVDVPMERIPWANWVLIGVTTIVSLAVTTSEPDSLVRTLVLFRGSGFQLTQLPGHLLVHGGFLHLLGNMVFLFCFGNAINAKLGHATFLAFYFAVGMLAGVAWLVGGSGYAAVGASGAIMGVVGAFLVLYPKNEVSVFYLWFGFGDTFEVSSCSLIACYLVFDVAGVMFFQDGGVAYIAHVVGALVGIAVAVALLWTGRIESTRYERNLLQVFNIRQ